MLLLITSATLPLAIISVSISWNKYNESLEAPKNEAFRQAQEALVTVTRDINQTQRAAEFFSKYPYDPSFSHNFFQMLDQASNGNFCLISIFDAEGQIVFSEKTVKKNQCAYINPSTLPNDRPNFIDEGQNIIQVDNNIFVSNTIKFKKDDFRKYYIKIYRNITNDLFTSNNTHYYFISRKNKSLNESIDYISPIISETESLKVKKLIEEGIEKKNIIQKYDSLYLQKVLGNTWMLTTNYWGEQKRTSQYILLFDISLIFGVIAIELMIIAVCSREYLVEPLEYLALAVAQWRNGAEFSPNRKNDVPLEVRQLERAFLRATRHLKLRETELKNAAQRQEHLIHEIHHRVKNNLQVIASLLNLHANQIKSPEVQGEFRRVRDRVQALSSLHHHLYDNPELTTLRANIFIPEIAQNVLMSHGPASTAHIDIKLDIDDVLIPQSQSVPVTLIITEILSNSLRYAFPSNQRGIICISLKKQETTNGESRVLLTLSDDGVGIASEKNSQPNQQPLSGIGRQLIRGFARQLRAELIIRHDTGTIYSLSFALDPVEPTPSALAERVLNS
ncbi:sensor histidine kinase [Neokomagataea tanensis]|uniref:histidine kinase n=3 Tax=Neokomagataea TaxID=1223423 RepID=A0A4Y6V6J5_9PROT|nr:histidine kinase dimerization/phosphoacceptor domain -containing protein [Neokomagataea tanensis]QDH25689.1 sensor histidine kinase [Neokomagataea tanensis]